MQHAYGWTAWAQAVVGGAYVNTNVSPNTYAIGAGNPLHNDFVPGQTLGNVSGASSYQPGVQDSLINVSIGTFTTPVASTHQSVPFFGSKRSEEHTSEL